MTRKLPFALILIFVFACASLHAQVENAPPDSSGVSATMLYTAIGLEAGYYLTAMTVLQNTWYRGRKIVPFHFYDDSQGYLQVDKFGHAFGAHVES